MASVIARGDESPSEVLDISWLSGQGKHSFFFLRVSFTGEKLGGCTAVLKEVKKQENMFNISTKCVPVSLVSGGKSQLQWVTP